MHHAELALKVTRGDVRVGHFGIEAKKNKEGNGSHTFDETIVIELFDSGSNFIATSCIVSKRIFGQTIFIRIFERRNK